MGFSDFMDRIHSSIIQDFFKCVFCFCHDEFIFKRGKNHILLPNGVLIYIRNTLTHFNSNIHTNGTESLWCSFVINHGETITLVTCSDSTSNNKEDSENIYLMRTECSRGNTTIICGDFNRPKINWKNITTDAHGVYLVECTMDLF